MGCRILITTGDPDGIGWEVTAKALRALGPKPKVQICLLPPHQRLHQEKSVTEPQIKNSWYFLTGSFSSAA